MKRLLLVWALLSQVVLAAPSFDGLVEAVSSNDEPLAIEISDQLISEGQISEGLYFNRGLAYFNLGDYARSRACFEQSLLFNPRNLETRKRLQQCLTKLDKKLATLDVRGTPWWKGSEAQFLLWLPALSAFALVLRKLLKKETESWQIGVAITFSLGILGILSLTNPPKSRGIVVEADAEFRANPEAQSGPKLLAGQLVEILAVRDHLLEVKTGEHESGWVRAAKVIRLEATASDSL